MTDPATVSTLLYDNVIFASTPEVVSFVNHGSCIIFDLQSKILW